MVWTIDGISPRASGAANEEMLLLHATAALRRPFRFSVTSGHAFVLQGLALLTRS